MSQKDLPGRREDPSTWPALRDILTRKFKEKSRKEWEHIFDGTDACCLPILTQRELENSSFDQRPIVTLRSSPGLALQEDAEKESDTAIRAAKGQGKGVQGQGWEEKGLKPSVGGEELLANWLGWKKGLQYDVVQGGLVRKDAARL